MVLSCSTYGRYEKCVENIIRKTWKEDITLEDLVLEVRVILKCILNEAWIAFVSLRIGTIGGHL
jgi:hypothetical protein